MNQPQIVIHLSGGVIKEVFSSDRDADVIVVDWDVPRSVRLDPNIVAIKLWGRKLLARVTPVTPRPLHDLAGSDIERAVEAAFEQGILAEPAC